MDGSQTEIVCNIKHELINETINKRENNQWCLDFDLGEICKASFGRNQSMISASYEYGDKQNHILLWLLIDGSPRFTILHSECWFVQSMVVASQINTTMCTKLTVKHQ